jgi:integrase
MEEYTGKNQKAPMTFFDFIHDFIKNSPLRLNPNNREKLITDDTVQKYRTTLAHIQDFAKTKRRKSFDFQDIDMNFYDGFTSYLTNVKGFKPNTIGKYISAIKTFLKHAETQGYQVNKAYQSDSFKRVKSDVDHVYLNESELMTLKNFDLSNNPRLDKVRDLFLLGAYTGLRFSDYSEITPERIIKNENGDYNIRLNQRKTGGLVVVPCTDLALEILNKYKMKLPKSPTNQVTNDYLKELCKMVGFAQMTAFTEVKGGKTFDMVLPKWQRISTHTARRSFATNAYKRGIQTKAIMQITGHKNEMSFYKYIVVGKDENADLMRQKLNEPKPTLVKVA